MDRMTRRYRCKIVMVQGTDNLILFGKLNSLLNGGLKLSLEILQTLFLKIWEGAQSKYFLDTILPKPYL